MTPWWRAMGRDFRLPGLAMTTPNAPDDTHENIHRSVFQLTFPFTTTVIPPTPPTNPPVIAPCWSLKGVVPRARDLPTNPPSQARIWTPRLSRRREDMDEVEIAESTSLASESSLVWMWVQTAHGAAQDDAREGDETETPLLTILPRVFQLPQAH